MFVQCHICPNVVNGRSTSISYSCETINHREELLIEHTVVSVRVSVLQSFWSIRLRFKSPIMYTFLFLFNFLRLD